MPAQQLTQPEQQVNPSNSVSANSVSALAGTWRVKFVSDLIKNRDPETMKVKWML